MVSVALSGRVRYRREDRSRWMTEQYAQTVTETVG